MNILIILLLPGVSYRGAQNQCDKTKMCFNSSCNSDINIINSYIVLSKHLNNYISTHEKTASTSFLMIAVHARKLTEHDRTCIVKFIQENGDTRANKTTIAGLFKVNLSTIQRTLNVFL